MEKKRLGNQGTEVQTKRRKVSWGTPLDSDTHSPLSQTCSHSNCLSHDRESLSSLIGQRAVMLSVSGMTSDVYISRKNSV